MTKASKDAKALLAIQLGDGQPLVPVEVQGQGAVAVVAAALKRLADLKRPRARVIYCSADNKAGSSAHESERTG